MIAEGRCCNKTTNGERARLLGHCVSLAMFSSPRESHSSSLSPPAFLHYHGITVIRVLCAQYPVSAEITIKQYDGPDLLHITMTVSTIIGAIIADNNTVVISLIHS